MCTQHHEDLRVHELVTCARSCMVPWACTWCLVLSWIVLLLSLAMQWRHINVLAWCRSKSIHRKSCVHTYVSDMYDGLLVYHRNPGAVYVMSHAVFAHTRMYDSMMREGDALIIPEGCGNTCNSRGCVWCCFVGWLYIRLAVNTINSMYVWCACMIWMVARMYVNTSMQNESLSQVWSNQQVSERALQMFKRMSMRRHSD
jgi:hypothetical protein